MMIKDNPQFSLPSFIEHSDFPSDASVAGQSVSRSKSPEHSKDKILLDYETGMETILFVEDLESLRQVISDSLGQLGYRVLSAASGEEALALAASCKDEVDLLLTDVVMPQMKGPELAQKLLVSRPRLKVIYVSGYAQGVLAPHGVLEPGTILLQKPFSIKVLAAKLREVLDASRDAD
jgi:CheY-like chemotaxis protein